MKMKKLFAAAAAFAICANMAACGSSPESTDAVSETEGAEASTAADSSTDTSAESKNVTLCESWTFDAGFYAVVHGGMSSNYGISYWGHNFYDTLVVYDNGEYKGSLAEKWEVSDDGRKYTFTLRDGIKFSDGTPCDAAAVKISALSPPRYRRISPRRPLCRVSRPASPCVLNVRSASVPEAARRAPFLLLSCRSLLRRPRSCRAPWRPAR